MNWPDAIAFAALCAAITGSIWARNRPTIRDQHINQLAELVQQLTELNQQLKDRQ